MSAAVPPDLVRHVTLTTELPSAVAERLVADVLEYFDETVEGFVRRRHSELQSRGVKNADIWTMVSAELTERRWIAPELSERQLRRIVYG